MPEKNEHKFIYMKSFRALSFDAKTPGKFNPSSTAERQFARSLRKLAKASGGLVESHVEGATLLNEKAMMESLRYYSEKLTPWATNQSLKLVGKISASNKKAWESQSRLLGRELNTYLAESNVGKISRDLVTEQVKLIKSIPLEAGQRAQKLAYEATINGHRANEIAEELQQTTKVTESRAVLIARTETARSNAAINEARAVSVGSTQYIWRTAGDDDVRESHAEMEGEICDWDDPPELSDGDVGHPGTFPNCRCYAEPVLSKL